MFSFDGDAVEMEELDGRLQIPVCEACFDGALVPVRTKWIGGDFLSVYLLKNRYVL